MVLNLIAGVEHIDSWAVILFSGLAMLINSGKIRSIFCSFYTYLLLATVASSPTQLTTLKLHAVYTV